MRHEATSGTVLHEESLDVSQHHELELQVACVQLLGKIKELYIQFHQPVLIPRASTGAVLSRHLRLMLTHKASFSACMRQPCFQLGWFHCVAHSLPSCCYLLGVLVECPVQF